MIQQCSRSKLAIPQGALDLPANLQTSTIKNWTDFGIWGLVFYDDQPPWFALIECMHILFHLYGQDPSAELFHPPASCTAPVLADSQERRLEHEVVQYSVARNTVLRHLLFRDTDITDPRLSGTWSSIQDRTAARYPNWRHSLSHLQNVFSDVGSLRRAISLLRTAEVEADSPRRWTSKHLLPLGPNLLFADIGVAERVGNADRRFMRRSGEMLYLMLGRASHSPRQTLTALLKDRLLGNASPWNQLARLIGSSGEPGATDDKVGLRTGYLPFAHLDVYDRLAEDWIALLSLLRMRVANLLDPLMRISALHLIIYLLRRARAVEIQDPCNPASETFPPFIFDLSASASNNPVQRMAAAQYDSHFRLPRIAIDSYLDKFASSAFWSATEASQTEVQKAHNTLKKMFLWTSGANRQAEMLESLRADSLGANHSIWSTIATLARKSGIAIARRGVGHWYAPDGAFLEALVLANVKGPMEMGKFLDRLYSRYRIVIGQRQALRSFGNDDAFLEPLKVNEQRLEERLKTLGFIDRKSDACAFVINPFYEDER